MHRQRCLLATLARQAHPSTLVRALPRLVPLIERTVSTDIPTGTLPALAGMAAKVRRDRVVTVGLTPPRFAPTRDPAGYPIVHVPGVQAAVAWTLRHPQAERPGGGAGAASCDRR
jgi:anionic cell wall polymer biosynthesis LytR-Cps2A-Psr (LCP) family protein